MTMPMRTPPQVAERLGVEPAKVIAWIRSGELAGVDVALRGSKRPRYRISEGEMALDANAFPDFNAFFSRQLKPAARPIAPQREAAIFPADGRHFVIPDLAGRAGAWLIGKTVHPSASEPLAPHCHSDTRCPGLSCRSLPAAQSTRASRRRVTSSSAAPAPQVRRAHQSPIQCELPWARALSLPRFAVARRESQIH